MTPPRSPIDYTGHPDPLRAMHEAHKARQAVLMAAALRLAPSAAPVRTRLPTATAIHAAPPVPDPAPAVTPAAAPEPAPIRLPPAPPGFRVAPRIIAAVEAADGLPPGAIVSHDRHGRLIPARFLAAWLLREHGLSYPGIGRALGGRDHTTVIHAVRTADARLSAGEPGIVALLDATRALLAADDAAAAWAAAAEPSDPGGDVAP